MVNERGRGEGGKERKALRKRESKSYADKQANQKTEIKTVCIYLVDRRQSSLTLVHLQLH